jgi:hypothetical protein
MRLCSVFISILTVIALAVECRAGRPLVIDDAAPVDLHKVQVEAGIGMYKDSARWHVDVPLTLAYGLAPGLEVGVASGAQYEWRESPAEDEAGVSDVYLGAKWRFLEDEPRALALALAPTLKLPTADESLGLGTGGTDFDLMLIATKGFGRTFLDLNVGYTTAEDSDDGTSSSRWHYGVALRREVTARLWAVGEVFAATPDEAGPTTVGTSIGVQREVSSGLVLDAAIGAGLHDGPDVTVTVGLTWVF